MIVKCRFVLLGLCNRAGLSDVPPSQSPDLYPFADVLCERVVYLPAQWGCALEMRFRSSAILQVLPSHKTASCI